MSTKYPKKTVELWLKEVDYDFVGYMPTDMALLFVNFIKEVNDGQEENETPIVHLKMMDRVFNKDKRCAILCHRGIGKTSLFGEYLILFMAAFGDLPGFGKVNLVLYVTDSIENGVKNLRRNVEFRYAESDFLHKLVPNKRIMMGTNNKGYVGIDQYDDAAITGHKFTDIRLEFRNNREHILVVRGFGAKALSLDTKVILASGQYKTIAATQIGDQILTPQGQVQQILDKSPIFNRPMYQITLEDGRTLKVCIEHLNSVVVKTRVGDRQIYTDQVLSTQELLNLDLYHTRYRKLKTQAPYYSKEKLLFIRNTDPVKLPYKKQFIDAYTLGLLIGDGSLKKDGSCVLHCHKNDFIYYAEHISDKLGKPYIDKRNGTVLSIAIKGISQKIRDIKLNVHGNYKFIPQDYLFSAITQRLAILQGLMDTDGSIQKNGRMDFCSNSEQLVDDVSTLIRSIGGTVKKRIIKKAFRIEIWININPFRLPRKASQFRPTKIKPLVAIKSILPITDEPSQCIRVSGVYHEFLVEDFIRTHNTGVRGAKELGQRPTLAILDDLISDTDAESPTVIKTIENTVYKAVSKALHPTNQKIIWLGTPFNARDPLYKAVESGAWRTSVYPICTHYPCTKKEFKGSWADRFPYSYVKDEYDEAQALGLPANFNQELMLKIMSNEDRLIEDSEIGWYTHNSVLENREQFNYYITTDFAVSKEDSADYSVIAVWALNHKGFFYWVDGICKKQLMDKNINDLFRLAQEWKPQQVGIEISGQQKGFIPWIQDQMIHRNTFFNLAKDINAKDPGIKPNTNKMVRFNIVVPWFKSHLMFFPVELKDTPIMAECINELSLVSKDGFKSRYDDFLDSISMLGSIQVWRPSETAAFIQREDDIWAMKPDTENNSRIKSYIV